MPEDDFLSRMPKDMDEPSRKEKAEQLRKMVEEGRKINESRNEYKKTPGLSRAGSGSAGDNSIVKNPLNFSKGGKISSASKRADGCCVKGKTKGKMV
jgi:hypothetical protein